MNRRVLAIGAGAAALILLAWYFLLWKPRADDLDRAKDRRTSAEASAAQLQTEIDRLRAEQRQEPLRRAQLERVRTLIPDEPNLAQFILDANDAAIRAGIDFISISPGLPAVASATPPAPGAPAAPATPGGAAPPQITLDLQIKGGYFQVLDFVNRLDALPRLVVTDRLTMTADPAARMTVGIAARMFTHSLPAGFGSTPAVATGVTTTTTTAPGAAATTTTTAAPGSAAGAGVGTTTTTTTAAGGGQ